jgi:multidrug resistance efflux pump
LERPLLEERSPVLHSTRPALRADGQAPAVDALNDITLELLRVDDPAEVAGILLEGALGLLSARTTSIWIPFEDGFVCRGAVGEKHEQLTGARLDASELTKSISSEESEAFLNSSVAADGKLVAVVRVSRAFTNGAAFTDAEQELLRQLTSAAGLAMTKARRLAISEQSASESARDLAVLTDVSREIMATLDLDRVLRSVVNLASRLLTFDRGAIGLYERGACDIRAIAGADAVDRKDLKLKDLAVRAAWAAGRGERFYLSDRTDPASDAERTFVHIFGADLERDDTVSGLYLPLKDEEGIVGILLFEAARSEMASARQRELGEVLANQVTVAVRNAQLYRNVPMAETLGALAARKQALLALPRRRKLLYAASAVLVLAALTLIRWPLRVSGSDPVFRSLRRADVRPTIAGVVDRVFVQEGTPVRRGSPVAHLRDDEMRAERDAAAAAVAEAERVAAIATAREDAAGARLQQLRVDALRREVDLLDYEIHAATIRAAVDGVVLTARPEERIGTHVDPGELLFVVGRTDSLELDLTVDQPDVDLVRVGEEVRLRVDAMPQQTFTGRVVALPPTSLGSSAGEPRFPVRAIVANEDGLLRPGMTAYARVLAAPASVISRLLRAPIRSARLFWWRLWS